MADFIFNQNVAPTQNVTTDTSGGEGGAGGQSAAVAFGINQAQAGDGGTATGGFADASGGNGTGNDAGDSAAFSSAGDLDWGWGGWGGWGDDSNTSVAVSEGGDVSDSLGVGVGGNGGIADADASANGGNASAATVAQSSADGGAGGAGGNAQVIAPQETTVVNDFDFKNSFNEDNDGVDNKGGIINDSNVAGDDIEDSFNSDDDTVVNDSFNTDNSKFNLDASDDDIYVTDIDDSFNSDDDGLDIDIEDNLVLLDIL
ncbi:MAG: hypothetical protein ACRDRG_02895 [Pseudonocardiaceae bacterium]